MFLSAGHSTIDPGACAHNRRESDIVEEFRNMVSRYLHAMNVCHVVDGVGTDNIPLNNAVKIAKTHKVAVEFHCNAGPPEAGGVEVLCAPKDNVLAQRLCNALALTLMIRNRGVKPEDSGQHHRLAFIEAGGIICELFFVTSLTDLAAYDARKWLAAKAVAEVLASM